MEKEILDELKKMNRLLTNILVKDMPRIQKIKFLNMSSYTPKEIATILGTTPNAVSVALYEIKKEKKGGSKSKNIG